jgi:septum formation protein
MLILASASPRRRELLTQAGFSFQVYPAHIPEDPYPNEEPMAYVTRLAREKAQAVYNELSAMTVPNNPQIMGAPGLDSETWESTNSLSEFCPALCQGTTSVVPQKPQTEAGALAPERSSWDFTNPLRANSEQLAPPQVVLGADTTVTLDNAILGKPEDPADAARMLRLLSGRTHRVITGVALVTAESVQVAAEVTSVEFLPLSDREIAAYIATGEPMDKAGAYAIQGRAARWIPRVDGCYFNVVGLPIALVCTLLESRLPR